MENKKIILYAVVGILLLLLVFSSFGMVRFNNIGKSSGNNNVINNNIPEECRKPEGQDLQSWKEHLSHHQNTLYCLDYFKNP